MEFSEKLKELRKNRGLTQEAVSYTHLDVYKRQELREMTGAGMMDCKKALAATAGDMDKAVEFFREKGLAGAAKKAGRIAAEGLSLINI